VLPTKLPDPLLTLRAIALLVSIITPEIIRLIFPRIMALRIQIDAFPMMHRNRRHPAWKRRENDRHSTAVIVPVQPRL
jgi:hypothetical protein